MTPTALSHRPETKSIADLVNLHEAGELNLEPGFQRQSVWSERDRAKLIESLLRNYPLPAIFLYRRVDEGQIVYDVIDGKQRLESILRFMGEMRGRFSLKAQLPGSESTERIDWNRLQKRRLGHLVTGYKIPVIEVDGDVGDIIDVFVRINSTGKALSSQEKRHARFYNSPFLKAADALARKQAKQLQRLGVMTPMQIARMKHVELMCELILSAHQGDVINRKVVLDRVMAAQTLNAQQTKRASSRVQTALNRLRKMFPKLKTTRFRQVTDFYSLAVLVLKWEAEGIILTDRRRMGLAWDLVSALGAGVDQVRENQRKAIGIKPNQEVFRDYLLTVSQMSDDVNQRRKREAILRGLLDSLFARKDNKRGFTPEQRRILWNTSAQRKCTACGRVLSWDDFTIDHIDPYSRGGRSRLDNAALMCRSCNSSKGHRARNRKK